MEATKTLSPHRQRKYDSMVRRILETAREIMHEQGVAALSMQELARRMDLRASSLYHYFTGKMDVYDALFRLGFTLYGEEVEARYSEGMRWQEVVQQAFEGYLYFARQNPDLYQLCFERPVPGFVPSEESLRISTGILHRSYERAAAFKPALRTKLSEQQVVDLVIAIMHGITAMHMSNEPDLPPDQGRFGPLIPAVIDLLDRTWS